MDTLTLTAEKREVLGRKVKSLRKDGKIPANIFGKAVDSLAIAVDAKNFDSVYKDAGETGLVEILVDKSKKPVLIHNVQKDPLSDRILHVDFRQVDLKQKITANVPVELIGESPAEKQGLGTAVQQIDEVEVESLPANLPEKFEIDISNLNQVDEAIFIKDIKVDKEVEIKDDPEEIIVKIEALREEEPEPAPVEVPAEGEAPTEGEVPAETPTEEVAKDTPES
jgi:large subunit ribosomal protein L25